MIKINFELKHMSFKYLVALMWMLLVCSVAMMAQDNDIAASSLRPRELFSRTATLSDREGRSHEVRATASRWLIPPHKRVLEFPVQTFLLVQLRAGSVITTTDGKEETHAGGDYWVVSASAKMSIKCVGEACTLDVVSFSLP